MALPLKQLLYFGFFQFMQDEGIVDDEFYQMEAMKGSLWHVYDFGAVAASFVSVPETLGGIGQRGFLTFVFKHDIAFVGVKPGIVNDQFSHVQHLKMVGRADHFLQLINTYCLDVESILAELASCIDLPNVDFSKLAALAAEVGEKSSCIGAEHVRLASVGLMQACDHMQKQNFRQALSWTKNEFAHTCEKLQVIVQMERRIMRLEAKQQK